MVLFSVLLGFVSVSAVTLPLPLRGWSTWNTFGCKIDARLVQESILALRQSPLFAAGYNWILIDDCWPACQNVRANGDCQTPTPRNADGTIPVDKTKFPNGFEPLTKLAHDNGIKMGLYTSVSARTCAGYTGSFQHEAVDAKTFADWGFDFIKHDTCGTDYSIHDGTFQAAIKRMREGIGATGKELVYYLDSGNPTSPQRVFNPKQRHVTDREALLKLATAPKELVWNWVTEMGKDDDLGPHMIKSWFDSEDYWGSTLTLAQNQAKFPEYTRCGMFFFPDMLTIGMGDQPINQYRAMFFLWAVLGSPLIMGNDIRNMTSETTALVTAPEVLAVQADPDCVQGSLARAVGATETWIRPLSDGSFVVVLLNKGSVPTNCTIYLGEAGQGWGGGMDFDPAGPFRSMTVRDIYLRENLGSASGQTYTRVVGARDAVILKMTPA